MKKLIRTEDFGKSLNQWQINMEELKIIKNEIDKQYDYHLVEEDVEAVCIILNKLGYIEI